MKTLKSLALVFGIGVFLLSLTASADEWDKKTIFTFSGPVQVANTQLPAGTYVFKLAESAGDRHIVQIWNGDETHLINTILANPDYRLTPTDNTAVKFAETGGSEASGTVPDTGLPIKAWFYPGDNFGQEFRVVSQPRQVAAVEPEPEPESTPAPAVETPEAPAPAPEAAAPPAEEPSGPSAQAETPQQDQTAPNTEQPVAPEQQSVPAQPSTPEQLPQTASPVPLVGLIGVLSLAAAASLRILAKKSA